MRINFILLLFVFIVRLNSENLSIEATEAYDLNKIKVLVPNDYSVNDKLQKVMSLFYEIKNKNEEAAILLLENGANFNSIDNDENTPLSLARELKLKNVEKKISDLFVKGAHFTTQDLSNDKHFIFLVASYNNAKWYKKNIDSIFKQNYKNYTVIYMDDMSTDNTSQLVQNYVNDNYDLEKRKFIFIKNKHKKYCLGNYLFAVKRFCPDNAIIITLDGDDWLANNHVLSFLNNIYKNEKIWLTYGNSIIFPSLKPYRNCQPININLLNQDKFRSFLKKTIFWPIHHLRSFYVALFRKIKFKDLLDENNKLFKFTEDVAFMLPMIEMAKNHFKFVSEPLYIYNMKNPLLTTQVFGIPKIVKNLLFISSKSYYEPLEKLEF